MSKRNRKRDGSLVSSYISSYHPFKEGYYRCRSWYIWIEPALSPTLFSGSLFFVVCDYVSFFNAWHLKVNLVSYAISRHAGQFWRKTMKETRISPPLAVLWHSAGCPEDKSGTIQKHHSVCIHREKVRQSSVQRSNFFRKAWKTPREELLSVNAEKSPQPDSSCWCAFCGDVCYYSIYLHVYHHYILSRLTTVLHLFGGKNSFGCGAVKSISGRSAYISFDLSSWYLKHIYCWSSVDISPWIYVPELLHLKNIRSTSLEEKYTEPWLLACWVFGFSTKE